MYAKVFASLWDGSLRGNSDAQVLFIYMLAHADEDGVVDIICDKIKDDLGWNDEEDPERFSSALAVLESPDQFSRNPNEDGRRLKPLYEHGAWGWRVVNYEHYRNIRNKLDRKIQNKEAQARWRSAHVSTRKQNVNTRKQPSATSAKEEEEVEVEVEVDTPPLRRQRASLLPRPPLDGLRPLPTRQGDWYPTQREMLVWEAAYPEVDIAGTWAEIEAWLLSNPSRVKTYRGMPAFINRWLKGEQRGDM